MTNPETARDLLARAESYLSALHGSVARHDNLAANLGCAGCELRNQIAAELCRAAAVSVPPPAPRADTLRWAADRLADEIMRGAHFGHEDARQPGLAESVMLLRRWADEAGEQQNETPEAEQPVVAYRSDGGRLLNCLRHVPPPAARHADFHPVTAEDLPDGGICTYPECGVDVLAGPRP